MVLEVELGDFLDDIVMGEGREHCHSVLSESNFLGIQLSILIVFVTGGEPVGVIGGVSVAAIVIIFGLLLGF